MGIIVHVTKNGKRHWQLYYVDPVTERRVWRSTKTTDRRAADRAAARLEADLAAGVNGDLDRITWSEFVERFELEHLTGVAPKTQAAYRTALQAFADEIDPARLASVTSDTLSRFAAALRRRERKLSETSIDTYLTHLASSLSWAHHVGLLNRLPTRPRIRGASQARHRPATGEELDRMLAAVPAVCPHDPAAWQRYLRGLWLSGLRLAESVALSWDQSDPFCLSSEPTGWHFRIYSEAQKSRRDQLCPVTDDFAALIDATPSPDRTGPVFPLGRSPNQVGRTIAAIASAANCSCTAHDFRRAFGTRWAARVLPIVLQKLMRHASITTAMRYYVHLDQADVSAALAAWRVNQSVNPAPYSAAALHLAKSS